ncbi:MAG: type II toxin-antitoxin system PemK/MazF family toxin [archaeon]|nr:type II toxin-antitoxin system PemK/MazF family toxin [archaeon]
MNSSNFEQGEIVVAPIPFSNNISAKIRPALVISTKEYNKKSDDIIVLKITSKSKDYPFDVQLLEKDFSSGKLKQESVIQADFPVVIEKQSINQSLGKISDKKLLEVKQRIRELYQL